jgi:UDP-N-acetyl-D-galactosamine dehydrogenase
MDSVVEWLNKVRIGVIGLGYVGLPLAVEFGKKFPVTGFDISRERVDALREGRDQTRETEPEEFDAALHLRFSTDPEDLRECNVYIVTVPTPIDDHNRPDLRPLIKASETVGRVLKNGDTVILESTVYPGCTEEDCVPVLERESGLKFNRNFFCGYSPERINPGDKQHRLPNILKVTSGSTPEVADKVDALYRRIITAGTYKAPTIRVAEAAKVIENTQRDLNIALINDLAILFNRLGMDTLDVLEAAGTKWNFLPFRPGLVGGHCIGVDPYYLTHKAQQVGHHPDVILAGRRTNDAIGGFVATQVIKLMLYRGINPVGANILILGLTFKENCPDLRNTKVLDVINALKEYHVKVDVHDPWAHVEDAMREYDLPLVQQPREGTYDAVVLTVGHDQFRHMGVEKLRGFCRSDSSVLYDVKHILPKHAVDGRL